MSPKGFRPLDRGEVSILAAFTLVVILASAGLLLQTFSPQSLVSQTAAAGPAAAPNVKKEQDQARSNDSTQCKAQKDAAMANPNDGYKSPVTLKSFDKNITEPTDCIAAVPVAHVDMSDPKNNQNLNNYVCVGRETAAVLPKGGAQGTLSSKPAALDSSGKPTVAEGTCKTQICDKSSNGSQTHLINCTPAQLWNGGTDSLQKFALTNLPSLTSGQKQALLNNLQPTDTTEQQWMKGAVSNYQSTYGKSVADLSSAVNVCGTDSRTVGNCGVSQEIAKLAQENGATGCTTTSCSLGDLKLAQTNAQLTQDQLSQLASGKIALTPTSPPPDDTKTPDTKTPDNNNNNNTFGNSGLSSLLSGLTKGLASSAAGSVAASEPCSTDSATYAQQQQQYQNALQQYNYQLQQYNYQLQLNAAYGNSSVMPIAPTRPSACTPQTQTQCTTQTTQPAASTCTTGNWQPVYSGSGNCITSWQCSDLGAKLSCQPTTADVGMSIAITYSCALGTASGSGFTASGRSGVATTTVAAPPSGTNTATYTLLCTNGSAQSGATCSVQVEQPSIVLVANPATISSGGTSQLGWVTSGMQACVISAPKDPVFNLQNSSNTSISGTATTLATSTTESYNLHCQTTAGGTRDATTTVTVR